MHTEHHIDSFDLPSFFKLHDLDMDGFWDEAEVQAVYGLRHDGGHSHGGGHGHGAVPNIEEKRERVVREVRAKLDTDGDGECWS
jgi:hypothetical protein